MNKPAIVLVFLVISILLITAPAAAVNTDTNDPIIQNTQLTTTPAYDRNPSIFKDRDDVYWMFFTRARTGGVRSPGYDPDSDHYDIYYKTASTIPGLASATETIIPVTPPDNPQRDISALQTSDGKIRVFTSTGLAWGADRSIYFYSYDGTWHGPSLVPNTVTEALYAAHLNVLEYGSKIWVFFDMGYIVYVTYFDENTLTWSSLIQIAENASIAKAIVDGGNFYVVWAYVNGVDKWGSGIYLSTSSDGTNWNTTTNPIADWGSGATNWDPNLIKEGSLFRLYWAPDIGDGGQFLATSTSDDPTDESSWTTPVALTVSSNAGNNWWDFWPQPYSEGYRYLFYTSERNSPGTDRSDANIWMMKFIYQSYLPVLTK